MKEESREGRVEELGKGREVGGNVNWLCPSICPGTRGLNSAHGGISCLAFSGLFFVFFFQLRVSFMRQCLMPCANLQDLGQLVATSFSLLVKIGT